MAAPKPATVRQAADALRITPRAVQLDIQAGCDGIVRPGKPGPGNGALLDLDRYRRWRDRTPDTDELVAQERDRSWLLLCEAVRSTLKDSGGVSRQNRQHATRFAKTLLDRHHQALFRRLPDFPAELRTEFRVYLNWSEVSEDHS